MIMNCEYCGTEFEAKRATARFCSPAHRARFNELEGEDAVKLKDAGIKPVRAPDIPPDLKGIDKAWAEHQGIYGVNLLPVDKTQTKDCIMCKKEFKTRLSSMRYCSVKCHPSL